MVITEKDRMPQQVPKEVRRWNWGGFLLNWIWGIGNNTYIALLIFVPVFGLIMPFVLGIKGSEWAWRNGRWDSVAHFKRVQRRWAIWGFVLLGAAAIFFGTVFGLVSYLLMDSDAYKMGVARLQRNEYAINALGLPISTGFPLGSIKTDGQSGQAILDFSVRGSKSSGRVVLQAKETEGSWSLIYMRLSVNGQDKSVDLLE